MGDPKARQVSRYIYQSPVQEKDDEEDVCKGGGREKPRGELEKGREDRLGGVPLST